MNEEFFVEYSYVDGKLCKRSHIERINKVIFAGFKRFFDVFLSVIGLIITLPILIIIGLAIKIDSKGPVLFRQERTGKHGKTFTLYKFRTMVADNDVHDFSKQDKHTKVGTFLRKTSLDELPQLINIAKSDMSFIGPRPWITDYYENMNEMQRHRNDVRPGITGLAQAMGRNNLTIFDKINYDLEYINNYSFKQDIKVIYLTIKTVLSQNGADAGKGTIESELDDLRKQDKRVKVK